MIKKSIPFVVFFLLVGLYFAWPKLSSKAPEAPSKFFLVKKVAQFTGTSAIGKAMSANDVVGTHPHELAVTDNMWNEVFEFDYKGKLVRKWGKKGDKGPYEFSEPSGITSDRAGHLYVMDTWNGAIKGFDFNGKAAQTVDLSKQGVFYGPRRICWDNNTFLVSDGAHGQVVRVSPEGEILGVLGSKGTEKGKLEGVSSTIVDGQGNVYVCSIGTRNRVVVYDKTGKFLKEIETGVTPDDLALDSQGRLFVGSYTNVSKVYGANGDFLGFMADETEPTRPLGGMQGIDITSDGYILSSGADVISVWQVAEPPKN